MKEFTTYLQFDGMAGEAMKLYQQHLGGKLAMSTFGDMPNCPMPDEAKSRVMHARLSREDGEPILMASDCPPGMPLSVGNNFSVSINCDSDEEAQRLFDGLGEGGQVTMPLQDMFWGAYFGMIKDKFGVSWMFNHQKTPLEM